MRYWPFALLFLVQVSHAQEDVGLVSLMAGEGVRVGKVETKTVKGRGEPIRIYEILDLKEDARGVDG
jgi:hypothetical protein